MLLYAMFRPVLKLRGLRGSGSGANRILGLPPASPGVDGRELCDCSEEGRKAGSGEGGGMILAGGLREAVLPDAVDPPCKVWKEKDGSERRWEWPPLMRMPPCGRESAATKAGLGGMRREERWLSRDMVRWTVRVWMGAGCNNDAGDG